MIKVDVYNQQGKIVDTKKLDSDIFEKEINNDLVHQVVVSLLSNKRHPFAHTKTRSDKRGGGRKPWRQKGTGRARAGTIRSPLWRGGGVTFGPTKERNYQKKINKKLRKKVFLMCLTDKAKEKNIYVLDKIDLQEIKTKDFFNILSKLKIEQNKKILFSLDDKNIKTIKSARNIKNIKTIKITSLNILDILKSDYLLTTVKGIDKIVKHYKQI
ncbi:50S ribosomal protein L4 [Patescibacteria group bacterium]|nr:50S ribosomal protein L4 [Patescibacteria group bacterium]